MAELLGSLLVRGLESQNLALRQQTNVLRRKATCPPTLVVWTKPV